MSELNVSLESKDLTKAINFIASIADMFSTNIGGVSSTDNVLLETNKGKLYCTYAKHYPLMKHHQYL